MTLTDFIIRTAAAFTLGACIGFERQWRQRTAGLRTNTLVCVGSALFVLASAGLPNDASPSRVAAQVVSGIGFLGAGVIMKDGLNIRGLNTAATLWASAAIGVLSGFGLLLQAIVGTLFVILLHVGLRPITVLMNRRISKQDNLFTIYRIEVKTRDSFEARVRKMLAKTFDQETLHLKNLNSEDLPNSSRVLITAEVLADGKQNHAIETLIGQLVQSRHIQSANWKIIEESTD